MKELERLETYLAVSNYSPLTVYTYKLAVKDLVAKGITEENVYEYVKSLTKYKPSTRKVKIAALKALLKANRIKIDIPVDRIRVKNNYRDYEDVPFQVFESIKFKSLRDKIVVLMLVYHGLRRAELENLKWDDIDFERGIMTIKGKGDKIRIVPLNRKIVGDLLAWRKHLKRLRRDQTRVMPYSRVTIWRIVKRYTGKYPHYLRAVFATNVSKEDIVVAQELLGHESIGTTRRYVRRDRSSIERVYHKVFKDTPVELQENGA